MSAFSQKRTLVQETLLDDFHLGPSLRGYMDTRFD